MKILGIDTSTSCGSIGLINDDTVIAEYLLNVPTTHSERLLNSIEYILKQGGCTMEELEGWAISLGPGSFTGLRIGVSTIKGLAFATQKPVAGIPTLDVLASNVSPTPYLICPILDARKGEVYAAFYRYEEESSHKRTSAYQAISPEKLVKQIEGKTIFLGSGVKTYGDYLRNAIPAFAIFVPDSLNQPHGSTVARLGLERLRKNEVLDLSTFTPIYVRASEAEIKWKEKHPDPAQQ
ncbi:MAG TPA: tRNA (adenosine(37)-N6)-threonylcarbamoyltransferase complex dimerization subunit type 1 TsaB [Thermodesulfobacteriota bacterium]|nr:tRNA (adenosine(37)-N6)-threonylcarbamoyltransferase complex dimerization subunit type 1 TsaB [Thermodesulfobacteriota bacterium]